MWNDEIASNVLKATWRLLNVPGYLLDQGFLSCIAATVAENEDASDHIRAAAQALLAAAATLQNRPDLVTSPGHTAAPIVSKPDGRA